MTHIATQNDANYIQRNSTKRAQKMQPPDRQSITQNAKYCDIFGQTSVCSKIIDSCIGSFVNYLDETSVCPTFHQMPFQKLSQSL